MNILKIKKKYPPFFSLLLSMSTDEKIEKEQDKTLSKLSKASGLSHKKLPFWKTSFFQTSKGTLSFRSPYSSLDHIKSIKKKEMHGAC